MTTHARSDELSQRAAAVEAAFRVRKGLYLIGSLERGVTVYSQQVRAHNLVWALWQLSKDERRRPRRVAIVGGGIAGLTAAACLLSRFDQSVSVTVFEQLWDFCPIQQGADHRWLHPRIYDWPAPGSRAPSASLPVLNWSEGRASDVARTAISEFGRYCNGFGGDGRLTLYFGLKHFQISVSSQQVEWIANRVDWNANQAGNSGVFLHGGRQEGSSSAFDIIILATGFGLETSHSDYPNETYWRNEQYGQPLLSGMKQQFVISGYGDGALVDLCRLVIERFRQDTILYEIFGESIEQHEDVIYKRWIDYDKNVSAFNFFSGIEEEMLSSAKEQLSARIRKDTQVCLHIAGKSGDNRTLQKIFGPYSSFANRLLTFLLYRSGSVALSFETLKEAVDRHGVPRANVLCRYGANPMVHLSSMFLDASGIEARLQEMKRDQKQVARRFWPPGVFPSC